MKKTKYFYTGTLNDAMKQGEHLIKIKELILECIEENKVLNYESDELLSILDFMQKSRFTGKQ